MDEDSNSNSFLEPLQKESMTKRNSANARCYQNKPQPKQSKIATTPAVRVVGAEDFTSNVVMTPIEVSKFEEDKDPSMNFERDLEPNNVGKGARTKDNTCNRRGIRRGRKQSRSLLGIKNSKPADLCKPEDGSAKARIKESLLKVPLKSSSSANIGNCMGRKDIEAQTFEVQRRYNILKCVGEGKQGAVYLSLDTETKKKVAIKIVNKDPEEQERFKQEVKILKLIQNFPPEKCFPEIYGIEVRKTSYLVSELLGDSLMDIQEKFHCTGGFTLKVVIMIGIQLLDRIRTLHSVGYVHGDIKPSNIMFGKGDKKNILYLIDYGLCKLECKYIKENLPSSIFNKQYLWLHGTPLFASINAHLGWSKMFKKDDLESFIYMLINIRSPVLPWFKIPIIDDNYNNILQAKMKITPDVLCKNVPEAFKKIYVYIRKLKHYDPIDYDLIKRYLLEAASAHNLNIPEDMSKFKFYWLLESKRNTDELYYSKRKKHLHSCVSYYNKSNSDEMGMNKSIRSPKKELKPEIKKKEEIKQESKLQRINEGQKTIKNRKRKFNRGTKKRMNLAAARGYQSTVNSFS
ncbi:unnamed protein product [Moneuplotes crassus]|uniref:Casein kinase I n=1 Tax=Euplotes crassus TaxID=5936 RepID=A0AAD1XXE0_EUPCR|nr:unnamed protein product [Moneuplotes crassus]